MGSPSRLFSHFSSLRLYQQCLSMFSRGLLLLSPLVGLSFLSFQSTKVQATLLPSRYSSPLHGGIQPMTSFSRRRHTCATAIHRGFRSKFMRPGRSAVQLGMFYIQCICMCLWHCPSFLYLCEGSERPRELPID